MESQKLYRVRKEDFPKLEELLTQCFLSDPLYCKLIPDRETRIRLMPELFECDLEEFFETCEIYSDSQDMNALLVVSDESEPYNRVSKYFIVIIFRTNTNVFLHCVQFYRLTTFFNYLV